MAQDAPKINCDELLQKLAIPEYRKFCRSNGLNFDFWEELPAGSHNAKVVGAELRLQHQAIELFNELKPEYHIYEGRVVRFKLISWVGDIDYSAQTAEEFLSSAARNQKRLERLSVWLEISLDLVVIVSVATLAVILWRLFNLPHFPLDWVLPVALIVGGCFAWRWWLNTRPKRQEERRKAELKAKVKALRKELLSAQKAVGVSPFQQINNDVLEEKLGTALAEHIINRLGDQADDPEMQKYVLHDINDLLLTAGAFVMPDHLRSPSSLQCYLKACMQIPAQVLAKELPLRTAAWMTAEPPSNSPEREDWVEQGRWLLDQARLNGVGDE